MDKAKQQKLEKMCNQFRIDVLKALHKQQSGHPGGSLSVCEILTTIYFDQAKVHPKEPDRLDQDHIVLCKGHAAPMLYRVLAEKGYFPVSELDHLRQINSNLQGHPCVHTPGVDIPTGPLGIGIGAAQGMALGMRLRGEKNHVYAVLGDGEINEGCVWETAMSAAKYKLGNLIAILDRNHVQLDGTSDAIMPLGDVAAKWSAFAWNVLTCNGHSVKELSEAIEQAKKEKNRPSIIIAETVKGKGVSFMEGKNTWHGKAISDADLAAALKELEANA